MSKYPTLEALKALVTRLALEFYVEPASAQHQPHSIRVLRIKHAAEQWAVPCFDEFGDAEIESHVVRLHLVLDACECFEEAPDFETWRRDLGFPDEPVCREIHAQLATVVPAVRSLLGSEAAPIDSRAIEFNTDLAQALRACVDAPTD